MKGLTLIGGVSWWFVALVAGGLLCLIIYQYRSQRQRLNRQRNALLTALRTCVYALLIFLLLSPVMVEESVKRLRRPLIILIDTSKSMGFPAGKSGKKSRIDLVKEKLTAGKEPLIERLARTYDLRLYQFDTGPQPIGSESLRQLKAQGKGTRLIESLRQLARKPQGAAAIIMLSDGSSNGEESVQGMSSFPLPVFALASGEADGLTDIGIAGLQSPELAFRGRKIDLDFTIQAYGLSGKQIPLYFNRGRNLISTRSLNIDRDPFEQRIALSYTPREVGPHSFALSLPAQPGERITQNNQREFTIDVQRDKIRVLTLSGSPSWNYRFLRMALKQDPFIDLVSFVFLRTPFDTVDVPENQLSLIPFPIDEIFLEELKNFDIVILENFSYRSYFNTLYLEKVRDFVRDGGGLAMLGGARSFDRGGYAGSPLSEPLPVVLDGRGTYEMDSRLHTSLTPAGKAHPITRIFPEAQANERAWGKVKPLTSINRVARAKGEVLLSAASSTGRAGWPLLAVGKFGKGRTLALMTDEIWRWNFMAVGKKENPQTHLKLLRQAMRWLAQEPSSEQVQITSVSGTRNPGEKLEVRVQVLKEDYTPALHADLQLRVSSPEGEIIPLQVTPEAEEGEYSSEFTPAREGSYRLEAEAKLSGKVMGKDQKNFLVSFPFGEMEDSRSRFDLLKKIAKVSQGRFIPFPQWSEKTPGRLLEEIERLAPSEIVERQQIPLWSNPWVFGLTLLLLATEWWLRRSWGMI